MADSRESTELRSETVRQPSRDREGAGVYGFE